MPDDFTTDSMRAAIKERLDNIILRTSESVHEQRVAVLTGRLKSRLNSRAFMLGLCRRDLEHAENRLLHGRIPPPPPRRPEPPYRFASEEKQEACREGTSSRLHLPLRRVVEMLDRYERFQLL